MNIQYNPTNQEKRITTTNENETHVKETKKTLYNKQAETNNEYKTNQAHQRTLTPQTT